MLSKYEDGIVSVEAIGKILLKIREAWEEGKEERHNEHLGAKRSDKDRKEMRITAKSNNNNNNRDKQVFGLDKQQVVEKNRVLGVEGGRRGLFGSVDRSLPSGFSYFAFLF